MAKKMKSGVTVPTSAKAIKTTIGKNTQAAQPKVQMGTMGKKKKK